MKICKKHQMFEAIG